MAMTPSMHGGDVGSIPTTESERNQLDFGPT